MEQEILNIPIPSNIAEILQSISGTPLDRQILELAAIQAYESELITERHVMKMLGFESREELYALFKAYGLQDQSFTMEELVRGRETLSALLDNQ
jgi:Uncharacterised protein family (UPF0175)